MTYDQRLVGGGREAIYCAPEHYPGHDLFVKLAKLKNTLRHLMGETLITHLGLDNYED
ncbi:MAG: hypothetical protein IIA60_00140 [Candidatus Marinimicrobia bacterium]|nr:hypothetical protein [Candidatus Neomarinimicrobiota bacterium]